MTGKPASTAAEIAADGAGEARLPAPGYAELRVTRMDEGGFVVRGTTEHDDAREAVRAWLVREGECNDDEAVKWAADLPLIRTGLFRWTPCHESSCFDGGGHTGHLGYADVRGRGVFQGVYFTW